MLQEVRQTRQIPGEPFRRWFADQTFDLIVWHFPDHTIEGFQLCYRKGPDEGALTWLKGIGFSHKRVDDGEDSPAHHKMTPILVPDGIFDRDHVLKQFEKESKEIDPEVVRTVMEMLKKYPETESIPLPDGRSRAKRL